MLNWWLGRPVDGNRGGDDIHNHEAPETPAPVFAARALKSAIFGTPALPPDDDTVFENERRAERDNTISQSRSLSPTKPPGILLTPGTATTRRKTVSFGNEVVDKDIVKKTVSDAVAGRRGVPDDFRGEFSTAWTSKSDTSANLSRKTSLTRILENSREVKGTKSESKRAPREIKPSSRNVGVISSTSEFPDLCTGSYQTSESQQSNQDSMRQMVEEDNQEGEITMDLNIPHSQSGRYWKSEYEQYHEQAQAEMKKLVSYKQLAKSYAKLKDAENVDLSEKLKEYQQALADMEGRISQLSAKIALSGIDGNDDDSPELVKELARRTALSVQYKAQVTEFRDALEGGQNAIVSNYHDRKRQVSHKSEETNLETNREARKAREQLKDVASLKEELQILRQSVSTSEKTIQKLQDENSKLAQELLHADLRLEKHLEKCEKKRRSSDEQRQKRDEVVQTLQNDYDRLKEQAKSQRRDAEHLLKKRHDQVVDLKKEIASLRGTDSLARELQQALEKQTAQHDQRTADFQRQIEDLKEKHRQYVKSIVASKDTLGQSHDASKVELKAFDANEASRNQESFIPVSNQSVARPSKILVPSKNIRSDTPNDSPKHQSSHHALSETNNNGNSRPMPFQRSGPVQHTPLSQITPLTNRFSNMSLESPDLPLPSTGLSLPHATSRTIHDRSCRNPSMFNIASSPPKAAIVKPRASNELPRQKSNSVIRSRHNTNIASSHSMSVDSSRARGSIPPERIAAAKARLEQKQAEKRRAEAGKENVPN